MKSRYGDITMITNTTFRDGYNRLILLDKKTKKTYFIEDVEEKEFKILDSAAIIVALVFAIVLSTWDLIPALIISALVLLALEIYFRKFFIGKLREAKDFPIPENPKKVDQFVKKDSKILILMLVLSLILPAFLVYCVLKQTAYFTDFSFFENVNAASLALTLSLIGILCLYIAVSCFRALLKKKKTGGKEDVRI